MNSQFNFAPLIWVLLQKIDAEDLPKSSKGSI